MAGKPADARDAHIGQRIEQLRLKAKIPRDVVAGRLGISASQFGKYEKGANRMSAADLDAVGRLFDVPIGYFFEGMPRDEGTGPGLRERPQPPLAGAESWTGFAGAVARAADAHLLTDDRRRLAAVVRALDRALDTTAPFGIENNSGSSG
ncbi:transcriptional regulator, XRE family [Methylobacterium sp. 4-46]|uniref:helix-turn-helix domain-containing protein n=1 Tax=unclassified Methylobacterium TaxID=2615210 RepID=UPI000152DB28|nr:MULTISPECIES: helix-turn-helix transcriptional regulator [Methylobacterium]ACA19611.1 transcriptional regulator, XRE family [Methylobacterium sp. 4-46]WFT78804.1 helix-turn-helix transcriptional regulator [Methylobacterium nodulans]